MCESGLLTFHAISGNPLHVLSSHLPIFQDTDSLSVSNTTCVPSTITPKQLGNGFMVSGVMAQKIKLQDSHKNLTWL